jgi:hypothetical protein
VSALIHANAELLPSPFSLFSSAHFTQILSDSLRSRALAVPERIGAKDVEIGSAEELASEPEALTPW